MAKKLTRRKKRRETRWKKLLKGFNRDRQVDLYEWDSTDYTKKKSTSKWKSQQQYNVSELERKSSFVLDEWEGEKTNNDKIKRISKSQGLFLSIFRFKFFKLVH